MSEKEPWEHSDICQNIRDILERANWKCSEDRPKGADVYYRKDDLYCLVEVKRLKSQDQFDKGFGQILRYVHQAEADSSDIEAVLVYVTRQGFNQDDFDLDIYFDISKNLDLPFNFMHLSYFEDFVRNNLVRKIQARRVYR